MDQRIAYDQESNFGFGSISTHGEERILEDM